VADCGGEELCLPAGAAHSGQPFQHNRGGMAAADWRAGGNDFNLVLLHLVKAGIRVKKDDLVAQFDPTTSCCAWTTTKTW